MAIWIETILLVFMKVQREFTITKYDLWELNRTRELRVKLACRMHSYHLKSIRKK